MKNVKLANGSKHLLAAVCLSAGIAFAPHAMAQDAGQPGAPATEAPPTQTPSAETPSAPSPSLTDEKLQSFVTAFTEVERIKQDYSQRLEKVGSEAEQQQLRQEAGEKMLQAVETTEGISVDEYNEIIRLAQADPKVAQKLTDAIRKTGN